MERCKKWFLSFVFGSVTLCLFSAVQKMAIGTPLLLRGFVVPLIFGGCFGLFLGIRHYRVKEVKDELQKAHDELEHRVKERTAELSKTNALLVEGIHERKLAEEALAEKSIYLDNILRSATEYAIATTDLNFRITYYQCRFLNRLFCIQRKSVFV
jgi:hypothetical protein